MTIESDAKIDFQPRSLLAKSTVEVRHGSQYARPGADPNGNFLAHQRNALLVGGTSTRLHHRYDFNTGYES